MRNFIFLVSLLLLMYGCQKEESSLVSLPGVSGELYCTMEGFDVTKTSVDNNGNVLWSSGDQIVAFRCNTLPLKYQIQERYVGRTTGGFSKVNESGSDDDMFTSQDIDHNVLVYPYSTDVWCEKADNKTPTQSYGIDLILPTEQEYSENSFGNGTFPMVAVSTNNQLAFKNICGGIKLQLKGTGKIQTITLKGGNNELLSGGAYVTCYANGSAPTIEMYRSASKSVTLNCGDGVQLNEKTATVFIIALPPVEFTKGFTVTITDSDGNVINLNATISNSVLRSSLLIMPEIKCKFVEEEENEVLPSNEIWYTSSDGNIITFNDEDVFGASIESNIYSNGKGVIKFSEALTKIKDGAFRTKTKLVTVSIPEGVTQLGSYLFEGCFRLEKVTLPSTIKTIPSYIIEGCSKMTTFIIPKGVTSIGSSAFNGCSDLKSVVIPEGVTSIGSYAFSGCKSLTSVVIPEGLTTIGERVFKDCSSLSSIVIPEGVRSISSYVFYGCSSLTSAIIPEGVTNIGNYAFYGCGSLSGIEIPEGVATIGSYAFSGCSGLTTLVIPEGVISIGNRAFEKCLMLSEVCAQSVLPPTLEGGTLNFSPAASNSDHISVLKVPKGCYSVYQNSAWGRQFSKVIEEGSKEPSYTNLSYAGTANCYLVQEAGDYKFRAVKGNSTTTVGDVARVDVLWESFGTDITPIVDDLIASVGYKDGYVTFSTPETFSNGNAVIAAKDASGKILWSWHIWCSKEGWTDQVYANNAGIMMDRNLGATSATPGDVGALGLLYQWGRKDPFLGSSSISEPKLARYAGSYNTSSSSTEEQGWMDSQKTLYDPCPAGYRVPEGGSDGFWAVSKVEAEYDDTNKGLYWKLANGELAWYPAAGYRYYINGEFSRVGSRGHYWSSTPHPNGEAYHLYFDRAGLVYPASSFNGRRGGHSVRCLRE